MALGDRPQAGQKPDTRRRPGAAPANMMYPGPMETKAASARNSGQDRHRHGRRRRPDRRAVDDQYRHGRCRSDGGASRGVGARGLGARPHHRRSRRGRRRRAAYQGAARPARRRCAAHRRLPLQRPHASERASGLRRGAGQVSHQSRQCRLQGQARQAVRRDHRDRASSRQAGADRRQLGKPRPGAAHAADGREREPCPSQWTLAR